MSGKSVSNVGNGNCLTFDVPQLSAWGMILIWGMIVDLAGHRGVLYFYFYNDNSSTKTLVDGIVNGISIYSDGAKIYIHKASNSGFTFVLHGISSANIATVSDVSTFTKLL